MCYDKGDEQILGPHKYVQVVMARGEYLYFINYYYDYCILIICSFLLLLLGLIQ